MDGRWVCQRCVTANDNAVVACSKCGLAKGTTWTGPVQLSAGPTAARGTKWPALLRFGWIVVILVGAIVTYEATAHRDDGGQVSHAGSLGAGDLRVGDCFNILDPSASALEKVRAIPCSQAHRYETYYVASLSGKDFPGNDAVGTRADAICNLAFTSYVGVDYQQSGLEIFELLPQQDAWAAGDRTVECAVDDPGNASLTGSLKDASR